MGGETATVEEFPWQAGLLSQSTSSNVFCGGSLISKCFVLTAAHCVEGMSNIEESNLRVALGDYDIRRADGEV